MSTMRDRSSGDYGVGPNVRRVHCSPGRPSPPAGEPIELQPYQETTPGPPTTTTSLSAPSPIAAEMKLSGQAATCSGSGRAASERDGAGSGLLNRFGIDACEDTLPPLDDLVEEQIERNLRTVVLLDDES